MRCSIFGPNAFSTRRAMSLVRAAFSLSKLESACLPTPSALDASVTVSPSGSITSRRMTPPTCGGFFIAILQIPPLMIVHQIKVKCVTLLEPEDHPPNRGQVAPPPANRKLPRQLPLTVTLQNPFNSPCKGCSRQPGNKPISC